MLAVRAAAELDTTEERSAEDVKEHAMLYFEKLQEAAATKRERDEDDDDDEEEGGGEEKMESADAHGADEEKAVGGHEESADGSEEEEEAPSGANLILTQHQLDFIKRKQMESEATGMATKFRGYQIPQRVNSEDVIGYTAHKKATLEEKIEKAREGKADRGKYGAAGKSLTKGGNKLATNEDKIKAKSFVLTQNKRNTEQKGKTKRQKANQKLGLFRKRSHKQFLGKKAAKLAGNNRVKRKKA